MTFDTVYVMSPEFFAQMSDYVPCAIVWQEELENDLPADPFTPIAKPVFKHAYTQEGEMGINFEPLLIDAYTQSAVAKVWEALKPETRERLLPRVCDNRGQYGMFVDKVWSCLK
ncbi:MAG: hypothetical protein LPH21_09710 [Shewanella sp.]|nr:hypothetical protein [Shewanella sp.]